MKIGPSSTDGARVDGKNVGPERPSPVRGGSSSDPTQPTTAVDRVSLSGERVALTGGKGATPFDEKKVEEVRRAIAEGRFPVDAKAVAEKLLADARDLLGVPRQPGPPR